MSVLEILEKKRCINLDGLGCRKRKCLYGILCPSYEPMIGALSSDQLALKLKKVLDQNTPKRDPMQRTEKH